MGRPRKPPLNLSAVPPHKLPPFPFGDSPPTGAAPLDVPSQPIKLGLLRDWFAGLAMQRIFAGAGATVVAARDKRYDETNWADVVADNAYEMADAMMKRRLK